MMSYTLELEYAAYIIDRVQKNIDINENMERINMDQKKLDFREIMDTGQKNVDISWNSEMVNTDHKKTWTLERTRKS